MDGKSWSDTPFRVGAGAFEMPNEAGVVHCFDEANRKALKKTPLGEAQDSVSARTLANLAKKRLFAEFRVPRDSPTFGFVAVGEPPTPLEIGSGTWLAPQVAELSLPSGLLRMETALSFSLWPELPQDDGVFAEVPPGDYCLTFVVAEYADLSRPRILLTLTPLSDVVGPVLVKTRPAPPPIPKNSKLGQYTVEEKRFQGWRVMGATNLDRKAARQLGLTFGERLLFESKSSKFEAWHLGEFGLLPCLTRADFLLISQGAAGHRSDLFCGWGGYPNMERCQVLHPFRFLNAEEYPEPLPSVFFKLEQQQRHEKGLPLLDPPKLTAEERVRLADEEPIHDWQVVDRPEKLTLTVLPDRLNLDAASLDDWSIEKDALSARVLTWSPKVVTLNIGLAQLRMLDPNITEFGLELAGQTYSVALLPRDERERPGNVAANYRLRDYMAYDELPQWLLQMKAARGLPDDLVSPMNPEGTIRVDAARFVEWNQGELVKMAARFGKPIREAADRGEPFLTSSPTSDSRVLCATGIPHWADPRREILWLESGCYTRDYSSRSMWNLVKPHSLPGPGGASVKLRLIQALGEVR